MNAQMILLYLVAAFTEPQRPDPMVATVLEMTPAGVAAPMPPAVQASPAAVAEPRPHRHEKKWHDLLNAPGWQGYGVLDQHGWITPERFRTKEGHKAWEGAVVPYVAPAAAPPQSSCSPAGCGMSAVPVYGVAADPSGFCGLLNAARAARGLAPVGWDQAAADDAARNNAQQAYRGQGHWVNAGYGQCTYVGPSSPSEALNGIPPYSPGWLQSSGHAAILLSPFLRAVGYAQSGICHTASGVFGY